MFAGNKLALLSIRLGLATVFIWFGLHQLLYSSQWLTFLPDWIANIQPLPKEMFLVVHAGVNVMLGALLALGLRTRLVASFASLWLFSIIVVNGFTPETIRDIGLLGSAVGLALLSQETSDHVRLH